MQISSSYFMNHKLGIYGPRLNQNNSMLINMTPIPITKLNQSPYDKINISKNARNLYLESLNHNDIRIASVKEEIYQGPNEYKNLDDEFTRISKKYKTDIDKINSSNLSDEEKAEHIGKIEKSFTNEIDISIDELSEELDNYFDGGQALLQKYSKDELEDLFDEDEFKSNFKSKARKLVDTVINSSRSQGAKEIYKRIVDNSKQALETEDMGFSDVTTLHKAINDKEYGRGLELDIKANSGVNLALIESNKNEFMNLIPLSDKMKESIYRVNKRISEGKMRDEAYNDELKKHIEKLKAINEKLEFVEKKVERIDKIVKRRGDDYGVSSKNKLLLDSLKIESKVLSEYLGVKKERSDLKNKFSKLSSNKSRIITFDSYKRLRAYYDEALSENERDKIDDVKII